MCGLCGAFGNAEHWSESTGHKSRKAFAGRAETVTRGRERQQQIRVANRVLDHYGLRLDDWVGAVYVLRTRTGQAETFDHFGGLWPAAELLAKRPLDPLDPALLAALMGTKEP